MGWVNLQAFCCAGAEADDDAAFPAGGGGGGGGSSAWSSSFVIASSESVSMSAMVVPGAVAGRMSEGARGGLAGEA